MGGVGGNEAGGVVGGGAGCSVREDLLVGGLGLRSCGVGIHVRGGKGDNSHSHFLIVQNFRRVSYRFWYLNYGEVLLLVYVITHADKDLRIFYAFTQELTHAVGNRTKIS